MFHEYALDPEVLKTWPAFRYLTDQFGMSQGRLISKFPSKWKRAVYQACDQSSALDKARIEESLRRMDSKIYARGRDFDQSLEWINNAVNSHTSLPFRAIITTSERCCVSGGLDHETISDITECWKAGIPPIRRRAKEMAAAAEMLLKSSSEIVFVDQHYSCAARHGRPLAAFIKEALAGASVRRMEYHIGCSGTADWFELKLKEQARHLGLSAELPLNFYRWRERNGGEKFHARYILTELGGMRYDVGLDESDDPSGPQTTDVAALDPGTYLHRWQEYRLESSTFELADAWSVSSRGVLRIPTCRQPSA